MNWDAIGAVGEIVGAMAVVASLIYLASQIKHQNSISLRDSRSKILDKWAIINMSQIENSGTAALMNKLKSSSPILTDEEKISADGLAAMYLNVIGEINASHEAGMLPGRFLNLHLDILSVNLGRYPGVHPFIEDYLEKVGIVQGIGPAFDRVFEDIARANSANGT